MHFIFRWMSSLQGKLVILITMIVLVLVILEGVIAQFVIANILEQQIGRRALDVSKTVSRIPALKAALESKDPEGMIQKLAEEIRIATGAEFIVVGDIEGKRYSHPNPEKLGQKMVGGDNAQALIGGKSYISHATGTLGPSIRGKVPVIGGGGQIIGVVSTGYLVRNIRSVIDSFQYQIRILIVFIILFGALGAIYIAKGVKRSIFGLEPEEIGRIFGEQKAAINSVREGIVAVNDQGNITLINQNALDLFEGKLDSDLHDKPIGDLFPDNHIKGVLEKGIPMLDQVVFLNGTELILDTVPIFQGEQVVGAVSSCRKRDEVVLISQELARVKEYSEMLRAQTHEFSNKIHTIAGLLQIGAHKEALEMIIEESKDYKAFVRMMVAILDDPVLSALLIGKYNFAQEQDIQFVIDPDSHMKNIPDWINREKMVLILGNLLNNAFEAVKKSEKRFVHLSMTDFGNDLIFDLDDSGPGISHHQAQKIFDKGVSSKNEDDHGYGLYMVRETLNAMGGSIHVGGSVYGGATFTVIIPKYR